MKNFLQIALVFSTILCPLKLHAQVAPSIEWQKSFGGSSNDEAYSVWQTFDGGYIIAGSPESVDGDITNSYGNGDCWIIKLDSTGDLVWQKSLGGSDNDGAFSIQQTADSGYIVAGYSYSNDHDVSGNHGYGDYWIVKLDVAGNIQWQKCLGGSDGDFASSISQTSDGGFVVAGLTASIDGDVSGNHGGLDYWIVKLDVNGNIINTRCFGGGSDDIATDIHQTTDGGFILAGISYSNALQDYWILRLDTGGNLLWQKRLGGAGQDFCYAVGQTLDGGFIVAGYSDSDNGDVSGNHGGDDYWIVKLDASGNIAWQKCYGGSDQEYAYSIQQTSDGGFIVAGGTESYDGDVSGKHAFLDYWIIQLDSLGNLNWQKCMGGNDLDEAYSVQETVDGGFIIAGRSYSLDGDITNGYGNGDYWIVKLSSDIATGIPPSSNNFISIYPNPAQTQLTINLSAPTVDLIIRVYDLQGRNLNCGFRIDDFGLSNTIQLNTENLSGGLYTLQITNKKTGECEVAKFVKEN